MKLSIPPVFLSILSGITTLTACSQPHAPPVAPVPEVATIVVAREPVVLTSELPGRTAPYRIAEIRPQVNGLVQKRLFTEGSEIEAGQELYLIDQAPFQATLDNSKAALMRAEAALPAIQSRVKRYQEALIENAVSQQDFDDASAALKQAEAEIHYHRATVQTARINLGYARVVSPISGRVGASSVTDGAIVTAYQPLALATVQQLDPIYVDVPQSTTELLRLRSRLEEGRLNQDAEDAAGVELLLEDGSLYPLPGTLQFRDVSVNPSTASVTLRMVFPNPKGVLLPGMFVRARVKEGCNHGAILIPQQAVARDPKGDPLALLVNAAGTVEKRMLRLDRAVGDRWLVASGLAPGDRVIVEGMQRAKPGAAVKEVPFQDRRMSKATPRAMARAAEPGPH